VNQPVSAGSLPKSKLAENEDLLLVYLVAKVQSRNNQKNKTVLLSDGFGSISAKTKQTSVLPEFRHHRSSMYTKQVKSKFTIAFDLCIELSSQIAKVTAIRQTIKHRSKKVRFKKTIFC